MGQFDDERTVELKAQINSAFASRAGKPGYDAGGWKTPGLANQATRDEGRRREQDQKQIMRQAQINAKKALRAGDMQGWQQWSQAAGGRTFGFTEAKQNTETGGLASDRQAQNAYRLNGGVTVNPSSTAGAGRGTPVNNDRAQREAANAIKQSANRITGANSNPDVPAASTDSNDIVSAPSVDQAPSATNGATTPTTGSGGSERDIPERAKGESVFAYQDRLARMRSDLQGSFGDGNTKDVVSNLRDKFVKQDAARAAADPLKSDDDWKSGLTGFYPETKEQSKRAEETKGPLTEWFEQKAEKAKEEAPISDESLFAGDWTQRKQKDIQFVGTNNWQKDKSVATPESEAKYSALKNEVEKDYETAARLVNTAEPFIIMAQSPRIQKFAKEIYARKTAREHQAVAQAQSPI